MADIYIRISDGDGETISAMNIWADGSDYEYAREISDWIEEYEGFSWIDEEDIP
jgi:hypothetical protein